MLDFGISSATDYGAIIFTAPGASIELYGALNLDFLDGFTPAPNATYDFFTGSSNVTEAFSAMSVDGKACTATSANVWSCSAAGVDFVVGFNASGGFGVETVATAVPEPSTWAMLLAGLLGLGALARRDRTAQRPSAA